MVRMNMNDNDNANVNSEHNSDSTSPRHPSEILSDIEQFLNAYMSFPDSRVSFPIALWIIATHLFESFDAFPYLCITASTKQAGKTQLAQLTSFVSYNPLFAVAATGPAIFEHLELNDKGVHLKPAPTLYMDEAEQLSKGSVGTMRELMNAGYRKGTKIIRVGRTYGTFSPKCFILIGDVYDTLRDRSMVVVLRRGKPAGRFMYTRVERIGNDIREDLKDMIGDIRPRVEEIYFDENLRLEFLTGRDEEIWLPLFALAMAICPERITELQAVAVDMCATKTHDLKTHVDLIQAEDKAIDDNYSQNLLWDTFTVLKANEKHVLKTADLLAALRAIPTAPWRRFRSEDGLTDQDMANMLRRFGVKPGTVRVASRQSSKDQPSKGTAKGYKLADVRKAVEFHMPERLSAAVVNAIEKAL